MVSCWRPRWYGYLPDMRAARDGEQDGCTYDWFRIIPSLAILSRVGVRMKGFLHPTSSQPTSSARMKTMCGGVAVTPRRARPSNSSSDTAGAADFMVGLELWVENVWSLLLSLSPLDV